MAGSSVRTPAGFIGAGAIASALIEGLCGSEAYAGEIWVWNRTASKAEELASRHPGRVRAAASPDEVVANAEVICPALVPDAVRELAPGIKFRKENRILHIAAFIRIDEARPWYEPARSVCRAVPLEFAARREGPFVLFGDDPVTVELASLLGSVVRCDTETMLESLAVVTGMMAPYYEIVAETVRWGMTKGTSFRAMLDYTTRMNEALSAYMRGECGEDTGAFVRGACTPGGANERCLGMLREAGAYEAWRDALENNGRRYGI